MIIEDYIIQSHSFGRNGAAKKKIVIGNVFEYSFENYRKSFSGIPLECLDKTPHYVIDVNGKIYSTVGVDYYTDFVGTTFADTIISIGLVNIGRLIVIENGVFDLYNNHYRGNIFEQEWKGITHWATYSKEQISSLEYLCKIISKEHNIPLKVKQTNVKVSDIQGFNGITFRSNYHPRYYDVTPAFNIEEFVSMFK